MGQHVKILVLLNLPQGGLQEPALGIKGYFIHPVFFKIYIDAVYKMDAAQNKIIVPLTEPLQQQGLVPLRQPELHAPADLQPGDIQALILPVVGPNVKHHGLHRGQRVKIHVVRKADLL